MINNKVNLIILLLLAIGGFAAPAATSEQTEMGDNGIQIYQNNPRYWQYKGKPVLLLGGTDDDNLFQWTGVRLIEQLNLLKSVGGNYVRCTMSGRDEGNVWPFKQVNGKYNLDQWDNEYWRRFENFLKLTHERDIFVQVEIWATYDFYREFWQRHPFNPKNNINYTAEQTGLSERVDHRPGHSENVFFQSVTAVRNQKTVLKYQRCFVDKMLSHSLKFGHVLYCMDNETAATPQWGKYWSEFVKAKAKQAGVVVQTTEMWYDHLDKDQPIPHATFDHPETYSFVDVSQNSHKRGQRHWDSLRLQLSRVDDNVRPLTNVKIYGADTGPERWFRADVDGVERFWRNIFGGMASARFHRPPAGLGLGKKAQANIKSLRILTDELDIFTCAAHNDLLSDRKSNEAYCLANPGKEYAVYFPDGGEVKLDISPLKRPGTIRWLEISSSKWEKPRTLNRGQSVTLRPPGSGPWVVLLVRHGAATGVPAGDVTFTRTRLTTVAETNMGHVPMVDINGDGVIDIVAGLQWFEGPSWKRHPLYPPDSKKTAIDIGFTVPYDLDGDGDLDLATHRRSSDDRNKNELFWFENPGAPSTGIWTKHHITWDTRWPEVIIFVDIDGDGRDEMVCSDVCPGKGIRIYEIPQNPENASNWSWTAVDKSPLHGLGIGDLNEDGRLDIVSDFVWFEQDTRGGWIKHSLPSPDSARRGHETMQIKVYDVDADGDVDLILPRAHHYGAYWLESSGGKKPSFKLHEILPGKLPSQLHGVAYADIDGDGDLDIFAGKSRYRHGDPGNDEPLDVFWIELVRSSGRIEWVKHQLATDLTMGIGPTIADVDADGDMDLVLRGHGIGGRYVIGARQTDVTLFIQNGSVAATAELTAKSARSITLQSPNSGARVVLLARHSAATGVPAGDVTFTRTKLTTVAETNAGYVTIADLNGDGTADIAAGLQWFEGPSWIRHPLYPTDANTLIDIGKTVPYDVDRDGDLDLVANRRPQELFWFENPGAPSTGTWTKHHITRRVKYPELLMFVDIDGDGRDEMVGSDDGPGYGIRIYEIPDDPRKSSSWSWTTVDDSPLHGLGIGDLNQDGRLDLISDFVWFQQTASGGWTKHSLPAPDEDNRGRLTMQINVSDVDGDGDQDVLLTRAHNYGAFWLESSGGHTPRFTLHEILPGSLPSQLHGVAYGDIDGDGDVDMFAGACRYRHGDPGEKDPLDVFWVELVRKEGSVSWVKHQLATDLIMGFNPIIGDVDGDGDMDLALRGLGLGGKYVIGTRQTDVTLFIQNGSVAATTELTAKSARSVTMHPPAEETVLPYGKRNGAMRVVYDNDQTLDVYTDEVLMAMASAGRIQLVGMITTRTVNGIGYDKYDELVAERKQMVNLARKSGMRHLPDPVKGPRVSLQPPSSEKIEDTKTIGTDGSRLIVREARKASPSDPLIVICGGQLTAVADAYLLDPSIEDKVVVAALLGHKDDMGGFNGLQDPWAAYIVLQRLIYVQIPERLATPQVPKKWVHEALPDTPLKKWMIAKIHPLFPDKLPGAFDYDGQPVLPLLTNDYVTEVKRVAFGGWKNRRFGGSSVRFPSFASAERNGNSRAYVVVKANGKVGTQAWQAAMAAFAGEPLPIIPGAAGFGMETPAGSGRHLDVPKTRVIKVTNLNDSGPGSLRDALNTKGPRVIVFEVSGYIELNSGIGIRNPYITVAGQTAPWPGIIVKGGYGLGIGTHDVLIQHLGFRPGGQIKGSYLPHRCAMSTSVGTSHVIIDHCSLGWSTQVGLNLNGHDSTVRLNIFSEGLYKAGHNEGEHSKGMGIGLGHQNDRTRRNIAVTGNLFAHNLGRNPCVTTGTSAVILNNLVYDYAAMGLKMMGDKDPVIMSVIGNVYKAGIDTGGDPKRPWRGKPMWIYLHNPASRVYLSPDNLMLGKTYVNPWEHINARYDISHPNRKPEPRAVVSKPPLVIPGYKVLPARETEEWVLNNVGPFPARRGPIDARIVYETRTRTGRGRDDVDDAGGWPRLEENHRKLTLPENPNGDDDGDGYTNIEEWLHTFADEVEGRKGPVLGANPALGESEAKRCAKKPVVDPKLLERIRNTKADWTFDAVEAKRRQKKAAQDAGFPVTRRIDLGGGVTLELAFIPAGEFMMGSKYPPEVTESRAPGGDVSLAKREYPARRVRITRSYYIGTCELTWDVWDKVIGTRSLKGPRFPALVKTDSRTTKIPEFIRKLNETVGKKEKLTFRLPTEAEWEYACRAGTDTPFWFGEEITTKLANYNSAPWYEEPKEMAYRPRGRKPDSPRRRELLPVGSFAPNPWGLRDTVGNAWELVKGRYGAYAESKETLVDPQGPTKGTLKKGPHIIRGGSSRNSPAECRSAFGMYLAVYRGGETCGLRLAAVPADMK